MRLKYKNFHEISSFVHYAVVQQLIIIANISCSKGNHSGEKESTREKKLERTEQRTPHVAPSNGKHDQSL